MNIAPNTYRYQLARLSLGNARSGAPIISGTRKLPSVAGIDGIKKNQTMITPCIVNSLLYVSADTTLPAGVASWMRITVAAAPPMKNKAVIAIAYRIAMRLWSWVVSHDLSV